MKIHVTTATGRASTELSAFDRALFHAGIANFNLLRLSSVIPQGAELVLNPPAFRAEGAWGDRLYVVLADARTSVVSESAWAGIGWAIDADGRGLFVEFEGHSEASVRDSIDHALKDLLETRGIDAAEIDSMVTGATCTGEPVCALVAAVYKSEPW